MGLGWVGGRQSVELGLAVHQLGPRERLLVDLVAEQLGLQIDLDDAGQMRVGHLVEEARLGTRVRQRAATAALAVVLRRELVGECLRPREQLGDARRALDLLFARPLGLVCHHQATSQPAGFVHRFGLRDGLPRIAQHLRLRLPSLRGHLGLEVLQHRFELAVAPPRHRQDVLQRTRPVGSGRQLQRLQRIEVVQRQQPPVRHQHQAADVREPPQQPLEHWQQRLTLAGVAIEHLVVDRQAIGRLHHAQQELSCDHAFLAQAVLAHVVRLFAQARGADGGQVVEHHRQRLVDERAQQVRHVPVDLVLVVHQRIHGAQQMLVVELGGLHPGHAHRLCPAQHPELGVGITQPVEHHHADGLLDGGGVAGAPEHAGQRIEADLAPELVERPHVTQGQGGLEAHLRHGGIALGQTAHPEQRLQQPIELTAVLVDAAEGHDVALARLAVFVAKRLDELGVAVALGAGDLDEHGRSVVRGSRNQETTSHSWV